MISDKHKKITEFWSKIKNQRQQCHVIMSVLSTCELILAFMSLIILCQNFCYNAYNEACFDGSRFNESR